MLAHYRRAICSGVADGDPERPVWPDGGGGKRDAERGPVISERFEVV